MKDLNDFVGKKTIIFYVLTFPFRMSLSCRFLIWLRASSLWHYSSYPPICCLFHYSLFCITVVCVTILYFFLFQIIINKMTLIPLSTSIKSSHPTVIKGWYFPTPLSNINFKNKITSKFWWVTCLPTKTTLVTCKANSNIPLMLSLKSYCPTANSNISFLLSVLNLISFNFVINYEFELQIYP